MKQFKGGLYANLGNYKSSLPQTKILNDFFNQNPVGYKKGGEVKGIKGVNYSRIPVTGGFMANAQGFQSGGEAFGTGNPSVSAFYGDKNRVLAPGARGAGAPMTDNLFVGTSGPFKDKIMTLDQIREQAPFGTVGMGYIQSKDKFMPGFGFRTATQEDFFNPGTGRGTEEGGMSEVDRRRSRLEKKEEDDKKIETIQNLPVDPIDEEQKGITGLTVAENKKIIKANNAKLQNVREDVAENIKVNFVKNGAAGSGVDLQKNYTESGEINVPNLMQTLKDNNVFETKDSGAIFKESFDKSSLDKVLAGQKKVTEEAEKAINEIGKDFYDGQKDGDAPKWALPLMMAGLRMAASDNPSLLGAAAEGGIAGMEEYAKKQAELRQDAKDKIALDMQKANAIINLKQKEVDISKDFAILETNARGDAFKLSFEDYSTTKKAMQDAITAETGFEIGSQEHNQQMQLAYAQLDQTLMIKEAELEQDYLRIQDDRAKYKTDVEYKKALLEIEMTKIANDNIKHQNLLELEKVSEGKVTTVFMPDADGNMKEYRVRNYYDYDTQKFETDIIGIAPPDQDYIDDLSARIKEEIMNSSTVTIGGQTYDVSGMLQEGDLLAIEDLVSQKVQQEINEKYSTSKDVTDAVKE